MKLHNITSLLVVVFLMGSCGNNDHKEPAPSAGEEQLPPGDNSRTSLDWSGRYEGTIPCADCEGIRTVITLNPDHTYKKVSTYIKGEKKDTFVEAGDFKWTTDGGNIIISSGNEKHLYKVGENRLIMLDMEGKEITGPIADKYILLKE